LRKKKNRHFRKKKNFKIKILIIFKHKNLEMEIMIKNNAKMRIGNLILIMRKKKKMIKKEKIINRINKNVKSMIDIM
jgi:hypothetical protein